MVINVCVRTARAFTVLMAPFLPDAAEKMKSVPNLENLGWRTAGDEIAEGAPLAKDRPPFGKLDPDAVMSAVREEFLPR